MDKQYLFFATVFRGLEEALAAELSRLGCRDVAVEREAVRFKAEIKDVWRLHLLSRLANKIVLILDTAPVATADEVYRQALSVDWPAWFDPERSFAVEAAVALSSVGHSGFCGLKVKDAVADRFRKKTGRRPDVERERPDVYVDCRIVRNVSTIGLNLSGERLFKRGYRMDSGPAPMKETLAAGIMDIVEPEKYGRILDPMAGSGTLMIEAAGRVLGLPPGRLRRRFGFEKLKGFDAKTFAGLSRHPAVPAGSGPVPEFVCADRDEAVLKICRQNIRTAGLEGVVTVRKADFFAPGPGREKRLIVFNPPYGERLQTGTDTDSFYKRLGDAMKQTCRESTVWIFTEKGEPMKKIGLRPSRKVELYNGSIECRLLRFEIY